MKIKKKIVVVFKTRSVIQQKFLINTAALKISTQLKMAENDNHIRVAFYRKNKVNGMELIDYKMYRHEHIW